MTAVETVNNSKFLCILLVLKQLRSCGTITEREYKLAKSYYRRITGAVITLVD